MGWITITLTLTITVTLTKSLLNTDGADGTDKETLIAVN